MALHWYEYNRLSVLGYSFRESISGFN